MQWMWTIVMFFFSCLGSGGTHSLQRVFVNRLCNDTFLHLCYNCCDVSLCRSPLAQMEEERREHVMKMKKMETEMEQVFEMKVKEKKQKLKDSEAEVCVWGCLCLVWLMSIFFPIALYICHWLMSQKSLAIFDAAGAASRTDEEESRSSV